MTTAPVLRSVRRRDPHAPLLVLLHEDGRDEADALSLGRRLWPGAPLAAARGGFRHGSGWRHLCGAPIETADLLLEEAAVESMAAGVAQARRGDMSLVEVVGVGRGGGADAVLALLCRRPGALSVAVLLQPRRLWSAESLEEIDRSGNGVEVLLVREPSGALQALQLASMLSRSGHGLRIISAGSNDVISQCAAWLHHECVEMEKARFRHGLV